MQQAFDAKAAAEGRAHDEAVARSAAEQREQVRFHLVKVLLSIPCCLDEPASSWHCGKVMLCL